MASSEEEYAKNEDLRREDVLELMDWVKGQDFLPEISEFQTILFLQSCYCDREAARSAICAFYTAKAANPGIFSERNPAGEAVRLASEITLISPLPEPTSEGYRVIFLRFMDLDASKVDFEQVVKLLDMTIMLTLTREGTAKGLVLVMDQSGMTLRHVLKMGRIRMLVAYSNYLQEALPVRLKAIHYINVVPFVDRMLAILRPFVRAEIMKLFHSQIDALFDFVPQKCLPEELGGEAGSFSELHGAQLANLTANAEFFAKEEAEVADLSKVPVGTNGAGFFRRTLKSFGF